MFRPTWPRVAAVLAVIAAVVTVTVAVPAGPAGTPPVSISVGKTVTIGGGPAGAPTSRLALPPAAQAVEHAQARELAAGEPEQAHAQLHDVKPPSPAAVHAAAALRPPGQPVLPAHPPLAAVHTPGCQTHLVRNFSSRNGAPVLLFVIHFTVSTDNGWSGVLGNVAWFDNPAAQASSNYVIDRRIGACALTVAEASKAWAQAAYNPWALSVEVTARGNEGSLVAGAGQARLLALMRRAHDVYGLPYRHGAVTQAGCRVTRSGFVMHADLGACGGGHVDVRPYTIDGLISAAAQPARVAITAADRHDCSAVRNYRHRRRVGTPATPGGARAQSARLARVHAHRLFCSYGKPRRR